MDKKDKIWDAVLLTVGFVVGVLVMVGVCP